ncbi:MAG: TetR/AcrR family transcriptional regulator [Acidimicrobiales bacterium]
MTARARARAELTEEIKRSARAQLAEVGASSLSVRAIARDLGMASSAVYRYFPGRDELLTALIVDGYGELADVAEAAVDSTEGLEFADRFLGLARAIRGWAVAHPHRYALLYGSPVPGYAAPDDTIAPAGRIVAAFISLYADAAPGEAAGDLAPADELAFTRIRDALGSEADDELLTRGIAAWTQLFGHISFELFGQFTNTVDDLDAFFDRLMMVAARTAAP